MHACTHACYVLKGNYATLLLHPMPRGCKCQERREERESGVVMKPRLVLPQKKRMQLSHSLKASVDQLGNVH